ncbi:hypothetical protein [Streptomonospora salina]|uniref:Multisubunit Na+/H+ antiporter MnhB subunit n=1 Tax=Streptomonospora salina TaxID=104205 RepID=A0A841EBZ1_9ACTN|nr:hypothetical protein [Streptomonospora salina]MBB5998528.1 multisubunit Na+/H+ antiporter MnhB subunit [Streptomonospora salina]
MSAKPARIRISDQSALALLVVVLMAGFASSITFEGAAQAPGVALMILACAVAGTVFGMNARRRKLGAE